jgi:succinoglycan biosynthesis transport protein ExoP
MELRAFLDIFKRWAWLIILWAIIAGLAAFYFSSEQKPVYRATSKLLFLNSDSNLEADYDSLMVAERLLNYDFLSEAIMNLKLDLNPGDLANDIQVESTGRSQLIRFSVDHKDPQVAQDLANEIPTVFAKKNEAQQLSRFSGIKQGLEEQLILLDEEIIAAESELQKDLDELSEEIAAVELAQLQDEIAATKLKQLENEVAAAELAQARGEFVATELTLLQEEIAAIEAEMQVRPLSIMPNNEVSISRQNANIQRLRETYYRLQSDLEEIRLVEAKGLNNLIIDEYARLPQKPISPNVAQDTLLAVIVGAMLAFGVAFLVEYLDDTVKIPADVEAVTGLPTLGTLQQLKVKKATDILVVEMDPRSPAAEAYRQIRTNLQFTSVDKPPRTLLVTSANLGEGKTTVAINLAVAFAQSGKRVLLVDTDMRRPMLHSLLKLKDGKGLSNMIVRGREDEQYICGTLIPNLRVMTAGRLPPNPAELLGSERMRVVMAWLKQQADYVVFDSPPVLAVTDSVILSRMVDTTLFVTSMGQTHFPDLETAVSKLQAVDAPIAGVIINKVKANGRYGYYYAYHYRPRYEKKQPSTWENRLRAINSNLFHLFR